MPKKKLISGVALPPGPANPSFGLAQLMVSQTPQVRELMSKIRQLQKPGMSFSEVFALAKEKYREDFQVLLDNTRNCEPVVQSIGPPPRSNQLYGRVSDGSKIVDVGSGDGRRVKEHSGRLKITAVDPKTQATDCSVKIVSATIQEVGLGDEVYTSFNSLCQIPDSSALFAHVDGIHVVPDHEWLVEHGQAVQISEEPVLFKVQALGTEYVDHPVLLPGCGVASSPGYKLCAGFKPRSAQAIFDIDLDEYTSWPTGPDIPVSLCTPGNEAGLNFSDLGHKMDGTFMHFEVVEGVPYITDRAGHFQKGTLRGFVPDCELHLEYMTGPKPCLVLLRILHYRGFVPPHSGNVLRYFADNVRLGVDTVPIVGPLDYRSPPVLLGEVRKTDGLISRDFGKDYYYKHDWTVDIKGQALQHIAAECENLGLVCHLPTRDFEELAEYRMRKRDGTVTVSFNRVRRDKIQPTTLETIRHLLSLPTIDELMVLYEVHV